MRRVTAWLLGTICGLVLLVSYHTSTMGPAAPKTSAGVLAAPAGQAASGPTPTTAPASSGGTAPGSGGAMASGGGTASGSAVATAPAADTVVTGPQVPTRRGPVQVQIRIENGRLVDIVPVVLPDSNYRDERINAYAVPILRQEALAAQSANIDTVSGATLTSDGYAASLQAALDSVHLGR
ncbi:MAG TPA: FMN-binding protein [Acidimicrobiia bacterium]|nr:FMN-binding protein [Acidimicrobiia bacterium]